MKVVDDDGIVLDATFSVQTREDGLVSLIFESSGGHEGGPNPRNLQYRQGLNVLLRRLQRLNAIVSEIRVETERTRSLPVIQQRVVIPGRTYPVSMAAVEDVNAFRQEISRYGRKVGQSPEQAAEGGGSSRRLRLLLTGVPAEQSALERLLEGGGSEADAGVASAVVEIVAGRIRSSGQGFLVNQAVRAAVERHAMAWAIDFYRHQGWTVDDVGAIEPYDLRCTLGAEERHVEVKGMTGLGETLILTRNEVVHAQERRYTTDLFVVTGIQIAERESEHPQPSGGFAHVWRNWIPEEQDMKPVGYMYSTGLEGRGTAAKTPWVSVPAH